MLEEGGGGRATGLLNKGGGSSRLPGLVTKQQAVEFPQVLTSTIISAKLQVFLQINVYIYSIYCYIPFSARI